MCRLRLLTLMLGLGLAPGWNAQVIGLPETPDTSDWRAWAGVRLSWKPTRTVRLTFEEQWRLKDDFGAWDRQLHQFGIAYSPKGADWVEAQSVALGFRHSTNVDNEGNNQGIERFARWHADYLVDAGWKRWNFGLRLRHQRQRALWLKDGDDPDGAPVKALSRIKAEIGYNIKGWKPDPELSVERFYRRVPEGWPVDASWRARLGTTLKTGKRQRLKLFIQRDWRPRYLPTGVGATLDDFRLWGRETWTCGASFSHRFKKQKSKD